MKPWTTTISQNPLTKTRKRAQNSFKRRKRLKNTRKSLRRRPKKQTKQLRQFRQKLMSRTERNWRLSVSLARRRKKLESDKKSQRRSRPSFDACSKQTRQLPNSFKRSKIS